MYNKKTIELMKESCPKGEKFLYDFYAMNPPNIWIAILIAGPFLLNKQYLVGVTDKSAYFVRLNLMGKASQTDAFSFNEIKSITVKNSLLANVAKFEFTNGRRLTLNISKMWKDDSVEALAYLQKNIL